MRRAASLGTILATMLATAPAAVRAAGGAEARPADPCPERWQAAAGPLPGAGGPADFGAIPEACPGTDATLRLRGALLVASTMPDYYGSVLSAATLRVRYRAGNGGWLSAAMDAVNYRYINNGGLSSSGASFGPPTLGYHHLIWAGAASVWSAYARVLLPFDTARENGIATGFELGGAGWIRAGARARIAGGVGVAAPAEITGGKTHSRLEPAALVELWYAFRPSIAAVAGAAVRARLTPDPSLLVLAPRLGGRVAMRQGLYLALLVEPPLVGSDRTDLVASLYFGWVR